MPRVRRGDVTWLEPKLVAEVAFSEWTHDGHVRQPSYKGLRDDKPAAEVRHERPPSDTVRRGAASSSSPTSTSPSGPMRGSPRATCSTTTGRWRPCSSPTCGAAVHDAPLPRRRLREGVLPERRALAHAGLDPPVQDAVSTRQGTRKEVEFPVVDDELSLLWMVNMGCIDMNPWYSRVDKPERPDFVLFDLDPTPGGAVGADDGGGAAPEGAPGRARPRLVSRRPPAARAFTCWCRIARRSTYDDTREFAELIAGTIARSYPKLATTQWAKAKRKGVLIDANQNGMGKTIASVYSVRPHPGRAGLDAARVERGNAEARPEGVHDGRRAGAGREAGRSLRGRARTQAIAREGAGAGRVSFSAPRGPTRHRAARAAFARRLCPGTRSGSRISGSGRRRGSRRGTGTPRAFVPCRPPSPRTPRNRAR